MNLNSTIHPAAPPRKPIRLSAVILLICLTSLIYVGQHPTQQSASTYTNPEPPHPIEKELERNDPPNINLKTDEDLHRTGAEKQIGGDSIESHTKTTDEEISLNDFYQVIIANNLFRPLGYKAPKPPPAFKCIELVGTIIYDNSNNRRALLRIQRSGRKAKQRVHIVGIGDICDGLKVEEIECHKVTLQHDGKSEVFHASIGVEIRPESDKREAKR